MAVMDAMGHGLCIFQHQAQDQLRVLAIRTPSVLPLQFGNPVWWDKHKRAVSDLLRGSSLISGSSQ
jgi:hypothetical protein